MSRHRAAPAVEGRRRADGPVVEAPAAAYVGRRRAVVTEPAAPAPPPVLTRPLLSAPVETVLDSSVAVATSLGRRAAVRTAPETPLAVPYVGRRAARPAVEPVVEVEPVVKAEPVVELAPATAPVELPLPAAVTAEVPVVVPDDLSSLSALEETAEIDAVAARPTGRRKAVRHAGSRGPLFKALPSMPVLVGLAAMSLTVVGVVSSNDPTTAGADQPRYNAVGALAGTSGSATVDSLRSSVSRDSDRDALEDATGAELVEAADAQAEQRDAALGELADQAETQADRLALNQWQLPIAGYHLTARFGEVGLWATYHTGLDFAAPSGTSLVAVANGTITSTGYDGAYGNKTVLTLDDGTEIWYCHQTTIDVSVGDVVNAGDFMGTVGATGNVTGPHLHLEVRPGGGDPVDPDAALREHGITP